MSKMKEQMRDRAWQTILSRAFFSVESAVIIALSIVLFGLGYQPFGWWQAKYWLVFGLLAEALYLGVTVTDPKAAQRAVDAMLSERFDPGDIRNPLARERLKRALEYRRLIEEAAQRHTGAMRTSIEATASEINAWIEQIYTLAQRMDVFEENEVISRDRRMVPYDLQNLRRRLESEQAPAVRVELEEAIQTKEAQLNNLRSLENSVKRADIQLDHTLSALGTVYAQVQLIDTKGEVDSSRTQRLQSEIHEEITSLQDIISAIDEVQSYQGYSGSK
jgi:dihydroneopterin aldolase